MDVVAIVALARSVEDEAPWLAGELGLTPYETAVMLRGAGPIIVYRGTDRARTTELLGRLRSRGHDAVACELEAVVSSEDMFRPRSFRFDGDDLVGAGQGEERRLPLGDVLALIRASHVTRLEDTVVTKQRQVSVGRAVLTGGLLTSKTTLRESRRVTDEREPVLYVFRRSAPPWLLASTQLRYDGLGDQLKISKAENFEVLVRVLRERASSASYDTRLLGARVRAEIVATSSTHLSTSSSAALDVLAHLVALAHSRASRPYR